MANIVGTKWGSSTLGTAGGTVTWSIAGAGWDISRFGTSTTKSVSGSSFLNYDFATVIASAFAEWSKYGDIEFKQVADGGGAAGVGDDADIRIFFGEIPGGTAGYAFYPSSYGSAIAGDIMIDTLDRFNTDPSLFEAILLHEIGHALGLGHTSGESIMTATVSNPVLEADDIDGIQEIYGVQDDAPSAPDPDPDPIVPTDPIDPTDPTDPVDPPVEPENTIDQRLVGTSRDDTISGAEGNDTLIGRGGDDALYGGHDRDWLEGRVGDDKLIGNRGGDRIIGGDGEDLLGGSRGRDTLEGGNHDDILKGGNQADVLNGGNGNDLLVGGRHSDLFVFDNDHGHDRIKDFNSNSAYEKIDLTEVDGFDSFRDVRDAATRVRDHVLIETGNDSSILIKDVLLSELDASDFLF